MRVAASRLELQARRLQLAVASVGRRLLRPRPDDVGVRLDRLVERGRHPRRRRRPARGARRRAGRRSTPPATSPARVVRLPMSRTTTTRLRVMNGGLCSAFDDRRERGQLDRAVDAVVVVVGAARSSAGRAAAARLDRVVVERERAVDRAPSSSSIDPLHLAVAQARVGALHHDRRHVVTGSRVGSSSASIVRHTRTVPSTSCTRTIRQPLDDAVRDRGQRLGAPVVDLAPEQLADEPLVRRRQQQRVAERRVHGRSRAAAPRSARASCRGRGRRRARSARARGRRPRRGARARAGTR